MAEDASHADPWSTTLAQMQQQMLQHWLKWSAAPANASGLFEWCPKAGANAASVPPPSFQQFGPAWELYLSLGRAALQEFGGGEAKTVDPASRAQSFAAVMNTWLERWGSQLGQLPNFRNPADPQQWWQTLMHAPGAQAPGAGPQASLPGIAALGLTRERQEAWQRFARLVAQYQDVQAKLARQWAKIGADTTHKFAARVGATGSAAPGDSINSIKGVYDLWIECAEEAYGAVAHGPEYCQLIAELANSSHAVRAEQQRELESWARQFDLPTRAEVNALHQQVKQLRAQLRAGTASSPPSAPRPPEAKKKRAAQRRPRAKK
jgi:class III poly(R)-hydroxyalkanoic acid synthase PhaE subunit